MLIGGCCCLSKGVIFLAVFFKIQSLCFFGDTLAGVIAEFPAFTLRRNNALFDAQNLLLIDLCAVHTVCAGLFNFLTKQHTLTP